jgi:hypothetical protein
MRRIQVLLTVVALMGVMLAMSVAPASAASQQYCFAAQRSADASGNGPTLVNPPYPNEGTYLSTRHAGNSNAYTTHKCFGGAGLLGPPTCLVPSCLDKDATSDGW